MENDRLFETVYHQVTNRHARFRVVFYPYAGIKSTIRKKDGFFLVKISDILSDAPPPVIEALAFILAGKLERKKIPLSYEMLYREYINLPGVSRSHHDSRKKRSRAPDIIRGFHHSLDESFERVNKEYFLGVLAKPLLTWTKNKTRRKWGHYDKTHHLIAVSRTLDNPKAPLYVIDFIMYHEMLHIYSREKRTRFQTRVHNKNFRENEKKFEKFKEAERFLKKASAVLS